MDRIPHTIFVSTMLMMPDTCFAVAALPGNKTISRIKQIEMTYYLMGLDSFTLNVLLALCTGCYCASRTHVPRPYGLRMCPLTTFHTRSEPDTPRSCTNTSEAGWQRQQVSSMMEANSISPAILLDLPGELMENPIHVLLCMEFRSLHWKPPKGVMQSNRFWRLYGPLC
ncbi:hypothetical protein BD410DRAFT_50754 [Rickenella mellea]|uniref:Uncharacterized protein n=1 Tax=Rickenella mellea TaxID=50990 RepID=A0A4R5XFW8_9AGAM|nr:hypothetical protein BD410DRAFT_50754 [Rickenella mellea]